MELCRQTGRLNSASQRCGKHHLALALGTQDGAGRTLTEKQDEAHLQSVAQYELDTLAESVRVARMGLSKGYATTTMESAVSIRKEVRVLLRVLTEQGLLPELARGRPEKDEESEIEWLPNFATPGTPEFESYQRLLEQHARRKG